jgi:hypothetical protein
MMFREESGGGLGGEGQRMTLTTRWLLLLLWSLSETTECTCFLHNPHPHQLLEEGGTAADGMQEEGASSAMTAAVAAVAGQGVVEEDGLPAAAAAAAPVVPSLRGKQ